MKLRLLSKNSKDNLSLETDSKFIKCLTYGDGPVHVLSPPTTAYLIQNELCEAFSDSNWDEYNNENGEFEYLQKKIAFAIFGPPTVTDESETENLAYTGYTNEQTSQSRKIFEKAVQFAKYSAGGNRIYMTILYACSVPLMKNTNNSNLSCYAHIQSFKINTSPIFKLRKCVRSSNNAIPPCCSYIDDHSRVYSNWKDYMDNNKQLEGVLVLPKDGIYSQTEINGEFKVRLDVILSPASSLKTKAINIANKVGIGLGLGSAGVFATAIFLPVIAPVMIGAGVASVVTGVFGTTVSSLTLKDRSNHEQTLNPIVDPEARGCWLNIGASSLGIAAGASSQILTASVSRGIAIGQIARGTHNGLLIASALTNGLGIANGAATMIYKYKTHGEKPSSLELLQLSSSLLFFCHSVVNMKTASQVIEETQFTTLEYERSMLRSNRHRKMFDKLAAETRRRSGNITKGNAEIIRSMRQITDKDSFFAGALRMNKQLNQNNVKISFGGTGEALLNGQHSVNPDILISLSPAERNEIFSSIGPSKLAAKNAPTKITFNSSSTGMSMSYELSLRSAIKIIELCNSDNKFQDYLVDVIDNFAHDSFEKMYDFVKEFLTHLLPIHFERLSAIGIPYNEAYRFIFQFVYKFLRENTNIGQMLPDFINELCVSRSLRKTIILRLVRKFSDWLRSIFDYKNFTTINCSICNGTRFSK